MQVKREVQGKRQAIGWLVVAVVIIALDQWTKYLASTLLSYGRPVEILSVFNLTLQHNTGAAFSFLADAGGWQRWFFTIISVVVSVFLLAWLLRLPAKQPVMSASLAFILAGAVGNLWDRVTLGYVVDFISLHYNDAYFPAFNIADSAITIGAGFMILDMLMNPEHHKSPQHNKSGKTEKTTAEK